MTGHCISSQLRTIRDGWIFPLRTIDRHHRILLIRIPFFPLPTSVTQEIGGFNVFDTESIQAG